MGAGLTSWKGRCLLPSFYFFFHVTTWVSVILSDFVSYFSLPHITMFISTVPADHLVSEMGVAHSAEACLCSLGVDLLGLDTETSLP